LRALAQPLVDEYDFGEIVIGGQRYTRDVIVAPGYIKPNWWRKEGHRLQLDDVWDVLDLDVDVVVIGTGYYGRMEVDEDVVKEFEKRGRRIVVAESREAVNIYNEEVKRGRKVMLLIHLTC